MSRVAVVFGLLVVFVRADEHEELRKRVTVVAKQLGALGIPVDLSKLKIDLSDEPYAEPKDTSEGFRVLVHLLGETNQPEVGGAAAFYDEKKRRVVFRPSEWDDDLIAHELCHAHQHQRGVRFKNETTTYERGYVNDFLVEGEAEAAMVRLQMANAGKTLADVDRATFGLMRRAGLLAPELLPYDIGQRFMIDVALARGWKGLRALYEDESLSMEQILHRNKLGRDRPTQVEIPKLNGATRIYANTFGELGMYHYLSPLGLRTAAIAAIGWDGDTIGVYRMANGSRAAIWLSVWDRQVDAKQVAAALRRMALGFTHALGRHVVWIRSHSRVAVDQWKLATLPTLKEVPPNKADAASTEQAEKTWPVPPAQQRHRRWHIGSLGLSIPIPPGWELRDDVGYRFLADEECTCGIYVNIEPRIGEEPLKRIQELWTRWAREAETKLVVSRVAYGLTPGLRFDTDDAGCEVCFVKGDAVIRVGAMGGDAQMRRARRALDAIWIK